MADDNDYGTGDGAYSSSDDRSLWQIICDTISEVTSPSDGPHGL